MQSSQGIEVLNPLRHIGAAQYAEIWQKLFTTLLAGFWAHFFFFMFIGLTLFYGIRKRNPRAAVICALLAALIAYGAGALNVIKLVKVY